ncbi:MAG: flotillin family protein [Candidatus Aminicenantia bacterium]
MSIISWLLVIGIIVLFLALFSFFLAKQYRKVGPNEVLIISGGRKHTIVLPDGTKRKIGYRYRIGGGTLILPFLEKAEILPIEVITLNIKTPEVLTRGGVPLMAEASAQVRINSDENSILLAAEQFLGMGREGIREVAHTIFEGKVREVIGTMTVEEIYQGRQEFAERVREAVTKDFARLGLVMISLALKDISDTQGYLDAISQPRIAAVKRDAAIAQAETDKESMIKASEARKEGEIARLKAEAEIAGATWENEAKKAESQVMVNKKKAQADLAYELERHRFSQEVKREESKAKIVEKEQAIKIEEFEIARKEKELEATVIKPAEARKHQIIAEAEAESFRLITEAKGKSEAKKLDSRVEAERLKELGFAEAAAMLKKAEAWGKYNQAAIFEMFTDILPDLAKAISEPLSKVDKIVVISGDENLGTSKITGQVANILAQVPEVINSLTGVDFKKLLKEKLVPEEEKKGKKEKK